MKKKPIITFARWGNYTIAFKTLFDQLGLEVIPPEKTTSETIAKGAKIAPEMYCFPMKVTLGSYLPALKKGANTIFMVQNVGGSCRQRYYGAIQEKVLKETGHNITFLDFRATPKDIYRAAKEISGASFWQILKAFRFSLKKLRLIEKIEKKAQFYRPREIKKGTTDQILFESLTKLEELNKERDFPKLKKEVLKSFSEISIEKDKKTPRVALVGEIYTVCDPTINFDLESKLGKEGIEVHREMDLTYHVKKLIFPWKDWIIQRKINPYLKSTVGGHGRDAIYEMLHYVKEDFDGVVHLLPFGCFVKDTNITIEGYRQKPIQEIKIGEKVLTHKGRFKKVIQIHRGVSRGKILKIDCGGKLKVSLTPGHPVLLAKTFMKGNSRKEIQDPEFIPASLAKKGDFMVIPTSKDMLKITNAEGIKRLGDERIKVTNRKNNVRFRELKDYFLVPIQKIEITNFRGKVYTLTVEDDHSYVANGLIALNCMPEVTVRPILERIHLESGIPFLSLSLDEQVAEAGINTRLEAFVDVVRNHYNSKK